MPRLIGRILCLLGRHRRATDDMGGVMYEVCARRGCPWVGRRVTYAAFPGGEPVGRYDAKGRPVRPRITSLSTPAGYLAAGEKVMRELKDGPTT